MPNAGLRRHLLTYALYLAVAVVMTWPLVMVLGTHFAGYPFGDAHEMTRHIWWMRHALATGQPLIFQPLLGYPDGMPGVILWSDPLQFFPGWLFAFVLPLPAAYNLFVLLTMALNGWAACWLVERLTKQRGAALIGGLIFMAAPALQGHLAGGHGGLVVQWPLPLLAGALLSATGSSASLRQTALAVLLVFVTPLGHTLQYIYAVLPLAGALGLVLLWRRDWRGLARLVGVVAAGTVLLGVFLLPVFGATFGTESYTSAGGAVTFSADLLAVITPSFAHPLYGQLDYTHRVLGTNIVEGHSYLGILPALLGLLALWRSRESRWWGLLALIAGVLSLGPLLKLFDHPVLLAVSGIPTAVPLPWALLADLPGFSLARTPGRFNFVLALAVAVLAGYGWTILSVRIRRLEFQWAALVTAGMFVLVDVQAFWPLPTFDAQIPKAVYELAGREDVRAVFDLPWDNLLAAKDALWLQTAHQKPLIAGQVTRETPVSPAKLTLLGETLDPALLAAAGADVVILHRHYDLDGAWYRRLTARFGRPSYQDERLALFDVPVGRTVPQWVDRFGFPRVSNGRTDFDLYSAVTGWLRVGITLDPQGSDLLLLLDNRPVRNWSEAWAGELWLPIDAPGYHTASLVEAQPCPVLIPTRLRCESAEFLFRRLEFQAAPLAEPIRFEHGVSLRTVVSENGQTVSVGMVWNFGEPVTDTDVRFVKLLDADGRQIAGVDESLGGHPVGRTWLEAVTLVLPGSLPPGDYRVVAGWYSYPDLRRFAVLADVPGAVDGLAEIGRFTVPPSE